MYMWHAGYFGPWMWIGGLVWILLLVGAGILIYQLVRRWQVPAGAPRDDPMAVLKIRYARGEITREQYVQMQKDLTGKE
jgi:putative membrane protein